MKRGFYTIMTAQFFSSLADNALFVIAVELLRPADPDGWQRAALVPMLHFFTWFSPLLWALLRTRTPRVG